MKLTDIQIKEINKGLKFHGCPLRLSNGLKGVDIMNGNWGICALEELPDLINSLFSLKLEVESLTDIKFDLYRGDNDEEKI